MQTHVLLRMCGCVMDPSPFCTSSAIFLEISSHFTMSPCTTSRSLRTSRHPVSSPADRPLPLCRTSSCEKHRRGHVTVFTLLSKKKNPPACPCQAVNPRWSRYLRSSTHCCLPFIVLVDALIKDVDKKSWSHEKRKKEEPLTRSLHV